MSEFNTPKTHEVKYNKNGYEIRADILALAKSQVENEYHAAFTKWKFGRQQDPRTGEIHDADSAPDFPGVLRVLEVAEVMYSFVNSGGKR